ncbi:MAG: hypothetical protein JXR07_08980 [Reichenbachiella sp.]
MIRVILVVCTALIYGVDGNCQLKKFYTVKNAPTYDTIDFAIKATSGTCFIKPSHHDDPVTIYGNPSFSEVNPNFHTSVLGKTNFIVLELEDYAKNGLSHAITYNMFSEDEKSEKDFWKVYLTEDKIYNLNLNYGVGDAHINLSDLAITKFKLESGSANVNISYDEGKMNRCEMDTFAVSVDMGTITVDRMHLSKVKYVLAEVGFGTVILDFSEGIDHKCKIKATIGAGKLKVRVPEDSAPSIVNYKNSPLCKMSIVEGYEKVDEGVYVNKSFSPDATNLLEFELDVALGNIIFEYIK